MPSNFESFSSSFNSLNTAPDLLVIEASFLNKNGLALAVDTDLYVELFSQGDTNPRLVSTFTSTVPIIPIIRDTGVYFIVKVNPAIFDDNKPIIAKWYAKVNGVEFSPYPLVQFYNKSPSRENILITEELKQWILTELGFPVVGVEITPVAISQAISNALRHYNQWIPKFRFGTIQLIAGINRYEVPEVGRGIVRVDFIRREGLPLICYTGDTCVKLLNGEVKTMKELYEQYHGTGKGFWVYSYDVENQTIVPGYAHDIDIIQRNAPIVKIILDNDTEIKCTPCNKFMLSDGRMVEAQDLKPGDSLMPLYTRMEDIIDREYEQCYLPQQNRWEFTHRLVAYKKYENQLDLLWKEGKQVIHHADCNRFNNEPDNLVFMTWLEHFVLHSQLNKKLDRRLLISQKVRQMYQLNPELKEQISERMKLSWQQNREKFLQSFQSENKKLAQKKNLELYNQWIAKLLAGEVLCSFEYYKNGDLSNIPTSEKNIGLEIRTKMIEKFKKMAQKANDKIWNTPEIRNKIIETMRRVRKIRRKELWDTDDNYREVMSQNLEKGRTLENIRKATQAAQIWNLYQKLRAQKLVTVSYQEFKKNPIVNHKVKLVLFCGYEDVYDFVVDKYHNFAVGGRSSPNKGSELQQKAGGWSWVFGSNSDPLFGR